MDLVGRNIVALVWLGGVALADDLEQPYGFRLSPE
jgi:hypothetical protein